MSIIEERYQWNGGFTRPRPRTNYIVLHHAAANSAGPQDIHRMHLANGWVGIGYHFYVRKDGTVYRGRPVDAVGAHCYGYNDQSVGVCAEGNFETEAMSEAQKTAIASVCRELLAMYPVAKLVRHRDLDATACPGKNYPFAEIDALARTAPAQPVDPDTVTIKVGGKVFAGRLVDGSAYAPVRALAEAMGKQVEWDGVTKTVTII